MTINQRFLNKIVLPGPCLYPARQNERGVVSLHERVITPLGKDRDPALRVAPEKAPDYVVRRSFGITKPLSSRLAWRFFRRNRTTLLIENAP